MGAEHVDRPLNEGERTSGGATSPTDVADAEAAAIDRKTSAERIEDGGLVASTTGDSFSTCAADHGPGEGKVAGRADDDPDEQAGDRRHLQQGSGQSSPAFGEQQQSVPPPA